MDDLLLHGLKSDHMLLFENLLIALVAYGLKLSPRKCQLFMRHLIYLGNMFHIKDGIKRLLFLLVCRNYLKVTITLSCTSVGSLTLLLCQKNSDKVQNW